MASDYPIPPPPIRSPFLTVPQWLRGKQMPECTEDWIRWFLMMSQRIHDHIHVTANPPGGPDVPAGSSGACTTNHGAIIGAYIGATSGSGFKNLSTTVTIAQLNLAALPVSGCVRNLAVHIDADWSQGTEFRMHVGKGSKTTGLTTNEQNLNPMRLAGGEAAGGYVVNVESIHVEQWQGIAFAFEFGNVVGGARVNGISAEFVPDGDYSILISAQGLGTGLGVVGAGLTRYAAVCSGNGFNATEARRRIPIPFPGNLARFAFVTSTTQPATGTLVGTVRKNGAGSALTQTVPAGVGVADSIWNDMVNTVACVAGDDFDFEFVNNGAANSANIDAATVLYEPNAAHAGSRIIAALIDNGAAFGAGTTNYSTPMVQSFSTVDSDQRWPFPRSGRLRRFYAFVQTAGGVGTTLAMTVMVNGVATALTGTIVAGASGVIALDVLNVITVEQGDFMNVRMAQTGAGGPVITSWVLELAPAA